MMQHSIALETAGALLGSMGTPQFTTRLWQWLHGAVDPSSYHMTALRFRRGGYQQPVEQLDVLFFAGEADPEETRLALSLYQRDMEWKQDQQLLQFIEQVQDPQLVLSRNEHYPPTAYGRMIAQSPLGEECSLLGCETDYVYLLSIFRCRNTPSFTLAELGRLRQTCHFLMPLLAQHARLSSPCIAPAQDVLLHYFDRCLQLAGKQLSARERLICHAMLQGWSVPQIAEHVSISPCSVRTYMERALTKIGVASKSELFAWCVAVEQRHHQPAALS
ncbi:helix-turn-helix transcriptional regulator [Aquitalea magnusonii]|uniref:LuxR family transcriptional regulator n=3 Tax=Chromobacteriaceae TaxID=1499392 RepID=A0A454JEH3_9NEIS|nr:helix-turn-helix transcriptional regulator [Aquitalea magnusonii]RMC93437.1 LuxR family transcriptional regulator [Aquitalea palustris]